MERLATEQNVKPAVQHKEDKSYVTAKAPFICIKFTPRGKFTPMGKYLPHLVKYPYG